LKDTVVLSGEPSASDASAGSATLLEHAIEHAAHYLPAQGPITVFIHHNTLHAFEDLPFNQGVEQGARLFGCQPYLTEDVYRQKLAVGRILEEDLTAALIEEMGDDADKLLGFLGTRFRLRLAMLKYPLRQAPPDELRWFVAETDALTRFRAEMPANLRARFVDETQRWILRDFRGDTAGQPAGGDDPHDFRIQRMLSGLVRHFGGSMESWSPQKWETFSLQALWHICRSGVHGVPAADPPPPASERHRDLLLKSSGSDCDGLVHDVLVRACAAFLDQGFSQWPLAERQRGFFHAFCQLYSQPGGPIDLWLNPLADELARLRAEGIEPIDSILESLGQLGVRPEEYDSFVLATLVALRGWAGMVRQVEIRGDRVAHPVPAGTLVEFLAVRLILDRLALAHVARETLGYGGPLDQLRDFCRQQRPRPHGPEVDQRAFLIFQLAQVQGWFPSSLYHLRKQQWSELVAEIEQFPAVARRRVFHAAFERRYRRQTLDAIAIHSRRPPRTVPAPRAQVICCLDEREESFRRHLEEIDPSIETFGAAGFFSVAMYYRSATDAHYVPLCPIVIRPNHWVEENVVFTMEEQHRRLAQARRALGMASHRIHLGSRTFTAGALLSASVGALASIPLVARVLFPRLTAQLGRLASRLVQAPALTQLSLERTDAVPAPESGHLGYTLDEMVTIAERLLVDIGLTSRFAPLVVILGHGSSSVNNPHRSAYDCGACGGNAGGPNARAAARMLNDVRVRQALAGRGLAIPDGTVFLGGWHNTASDSVSYFDLDRLPATHHSHFEAFEQSQEEALDRNAHERCRRFQSAPLALSFSAARKHVEERSEDLAQTRPECGHATNALCIVGRRGRTRGLYLDRRAFLTSYDPDCDDEERTILTRILQAAVPVCAGINLEYYFSYVDPAGWGCGTKLPHNVTSLLGIMDGAASDLRPGLPWQMVEIHDPVRLLFIIEATPEAMLRIMARNESIGKLCTNGWVQVATLDPDSDEIHVLRGGQFERYRPDTSELPVVTTSLDWYRGWRDHLGFAQIERGTTAAAKFSPPS
jgi:uncharacterized protein YbcC (UPF0753/DUF2309 family)